MSETRTIFKRIIDGDIHADIVYQDDQCLAFRDLSPRAPVHILVIPKKEIASLNELAPEDQALLGHLMLVIQKIAADMNLAARGFRVVCNCGSDGGQSVPHLHFHLLAGRPLSWPPG